jgi:hypothetical protein
MRLLAAELTVALLIAPFAADARGRGHTGPGRGATPGVAGRGGQGGVGSCPSGARSHGSGSSMQQFEAERHSAFQRRTPCPTTGKTYGSCPGYVVGDVAPAKRGGAWGMRWMTPEEAQKAAEDRY